MMIRWHRVGIAIALGLLVFLAATALYHPFRVWLAGGDWCIRSSPDGQQSTLYGDDCQR